MRRATNETKFATHEHWPAEPNDRRSIEANSNETNERSSSAVNHSLLYEIRPRVVRVVSFLRSFRFVFVFVRRFTCGRVATNIVEFTNSIDSDRKTFIIFESTTKRIANKRWRLIAFNLHKPIAYNVHVELKSNQLKYFDLKSIEIGNRTFRIYSFGSFETLVFGQMNHNRFAQFWKFAFEPYEIHRIFLFRWLRKTKIFRLLNFSSFVCHTIEANS